MKPDISKKDTWIVVPAYNEEKYLARVLKKVKKQTSNIVVVDDGSKDDTSAIASKFTTHVITHPFNLGKGAALKTGCEYATQQLNAQALIFIDSDDQHDPQEISLFLQSIKSGKDIVFGERKMGSEMPLLRIMLNRLASVVVMFFFGKYIPDIPSGYKALTKRGYEKVKWDSPGYGVEIEIAVRAILRKVDYGIVPITTIYHDLQRGMTLLDTLSLINKVITWRLFL